MRTIKIENKLIGDGEHCYIIAEAGSNHNGSLEQAKKLIDVAVEAEVDAVKFRIFKAENLYSKEKFVISTKISRKIDEVMKAFHKGKLLALPIAAGEVEIKV